MSMYDIAMCKLAIAIAKHNTTLGTSDGSTLNVGFADADTLESCTVMLVPLGIGISEKITSSLSLEVDSMVLVSNLSSMLEESIFLVCSILISSLL